MASHKKEVISRVLLQRGPWDTISQAFEKLIPFDSTVDHADELGRQIAAGVSTAHNIVHEGKRVGITITRVEEGKTRELVLVAVYCGAAVPLSREIAEAVEAMARAEKCDSIRFHTVRPAAARFAADEYGFRCAEIVMRKDLHA